MARINFEEYPNNPRKISEKQAEDLKAWLHKYGDISGIVFNRSTGNFPCGNQRSKQLDFNKCKKEYYKKNRRPDDQGTVAVGYIVDSDGHKYNFRIVDWDEETEKQANIIANKAGGEWDLDVLKVHFNKELLMNTGWSKAELNAITFEVEKKKEEGQIQFSTELGRTAQYLVLKFDNKIDWLQAKSILDLESTFSKRQNGKPWSRGIGRVIDGPEAIEKIRKA